LAHNFDAVSDLLTTQRYDILAVSETWIQGQFDITFYDIPGYDLIINNGSGRGSGVGIYIKTDLEAQVVASHIADSLCFDCACISFRADDEEFVVGSIYRNFRCGERNFLRDLHELLQALLLLSPNLYIMGDININVLADTAIVRDYKQLLHDYGLSQCITKPTRVTRTSHTLIDHLITARPASISICDSYFCPIADHNIILCAFQVAKLNPKDKAQPRVIVSRDMRNYCPDAFLEDLFWSPLHTVYDESDVDRMATTFVDNFLRVVDRHAPRQIKVVQHNKRQQMPVYDTVIASWYRAKRYHHWRFKYLGIKDAYVPFDYYRKLIKKRLAFLRDTASRDKIDKCDNPRALWQAAKDVCNLTKERVLPQVAPESASEYFADIGSKTAD
jgi:hypothetical protein